METQDLLQAFHSFLSRDFPDLSADFQSNVVYKRFKTLVEDHGFDACLLGLEVFADVRANSVRFLAQDPLRWLIGAYTGWMSTFEADDYYLAEEEQSDHPEDSGEPVGLTAHNVPRTPPPPPLTQSEQAARRLAIRFGEKVDQHHITCEPADVDQLAAHITEAVQEMGDKETWRRIDNWCADEWTDDGLDPTKKLVEDTGGAYQTPQDVASICDAVGAGA